MTSTQMNTDLIARLHSAKRRIGDQQSNANRDRDMYAALYSEAADALEAKQPIPYSGADENPPTFGRRWKLAVDGFGLQRDDQAGSYVHIDDALSVLHATVEAKQRPIDCRTCENFPVSSLHCEAAYYGTCTNGDKYEALPVVQLYRK